MEGEREGGREGEREGGKEGVRKGGREKGREGGREGGKEGGREGEREDQIRSGSQYNTGASVMYATERGVYCEQIYVGLLSSDRSECCYAGNKLEFLFQHSQHNVGPIKIQ